MSLFTSKHPHFAVYLQDNDALRANPFLTEAQLTRNKRPNRGMGKGKDGFEFAFTSDPAIRHLWPVDFDVLDSMFGSPDFWNLPEGAPSPRECWRGTCPVI